MRQNRSFMTASWIALAAAAITTLGALLIAALGVAGLAGWSDHSHRISLVPGTHLVDLSYQPSWEVRAYTEVCPRIDLRHPRRDCENVILRDADGPREDPPFLLPDDDIRAVSAHLEGRLFFDADPGWNPLIASLYAMTVLSLLVLAFMLSQLWLLLRAVSRDAPFTDQVVRRLRVIGVTLIAWELLEPFLWLFLSPKAWDYGFVRAGAQGVGLELGSMEPGGPQLTRMAFGALLLLLAQVFRRGVRLEDDQRLTV
ncbi:DUF2975 domain-containing protein [Nocardioides antri]|uniref:DUF2975 domain-containing protein n=1 Tax=Nocardioides antri TaxID=2607659 RepID=A0A5B1M096_9ACTN|nr:DUF2975 domain-containing protein [Nocardioides antri]KAA1426585.1 DUF2975 domain-containing protein [Nocardioides antri]